MSNDESPDRFANGILPEVDHATDLAMAPVIHPSTGPAPEALTGSDLVVGTGDMAEPGGTVVVNYIGALFESGETFDSSWGRGAATFSLSGVIPGFADGIAGMRVGGRRVLVIPPAMGYGAAGVPGAIPGGATLVFAIDLVGLA